MKKFSGMMIVLMLAGLWLIPSELAHAQREHVQIEREINTLKSRIEQCERELIFLRGRYVNVSWHSVGAYSPGAQMESRIKCIQEAKERLKELLDKLSKLPPRPNTLLPSGTPTPSPRPNTILPSQPSPDPKPPAGNDQQAKDLREYIDALEKRLPKLEEDAERAMEEMELRMKAEQASKPGFNVKTESNGRLWTATFTTPEGDLVLNLPNDMRAGDKVSGTVIANPKGQTEENRATNLEKLKRHKLMIANQSVTGPWGEFTWSWLNPRPGWLVVPKKPSDQKPPFQPTGWAVCPSQLMDCPETPTLFALLGTTQGGGDQVPFTPVAGTPIPERLTTPPTESESLSPNKIEFPAFGQGGRDLEVKGRFNGDMKDTEIRIGGQRATIRAESPRSCVFESPEKSVGLTEISIKENNVETKGAYRNIGVRLTAPKTSLLKGERTTVTIEVSGLEGIREDVPLKLESKGVINMERGNFQNLRIRPSDVQGDGRFITTRGITGLTAGGFGVTGTVVVDPYDVCLAGFGGYIQWNTFNGNYIFRRRAGAAAGANQTGGSQAGGEKPADGDKPAENPPITGTGTVTSKGCIITLTDNRIDRRIFSRLDACNKTGSAEVQVNPDKTKTEIKDSNTNDSCGSK